MLRTSACALFFVAAACGAVVADDFIALITKVEGGKVTFHRREMPKEGQRRAAYSKKEETLPAAHDVKAVEARFNRETKKFDAGPELPGGLSNERLKDIEKPGVLARVTTDDHDRIKELRIVVVNKGPSPTRRLGSPPGDRQGSGAAASQVDENSFGHVMLGMKEHRDRLKTGMFRAYGLYTDNSSREGDLAGNVELYSAFDRPSGRTRLDSSVPYRLLLTPEERKKDDSGRGWKVSYRKTKVVITPKEVLSSEDQAGALRVFSPDQKEVRRIRGLPFDVRCLGLYYWAGFHAALPFERIYKNLMEHKPRSVSRDAEGRWKIVWELTDTQPEQRTLRVDEASGFVPLRSETRYGRKAGDSIVWEEPTQTSDVTWALDRGVWVPRTCKLQEKTKYGMRSYDLSFEWEAVNDPVPDTAFKKEGLEIEGRTLVVDQKSGQRVVTGVLNDNPDNASYYNGSSKGCSLGLRLILVNGVILFVLVLVYLYVRHRQRRSAKTTDSASQP